VLLVWSRSRAARFRAAEFRPAQYRVERFSAAAGSYGAETFGVALSSANDEKDIFMLLFTSFLRATAML